MTSPSDPVYFGTVFNTLAQAVGRKEAEVSDLTAPFANRIVVLGSIAEGNNITDSGATPLDEAKTPLMIKHIAYREFDFDGKVRPALQLARQTHTNFVTRPAHSISNLEYSRVHRHHYPGRINHFLYRQCNLALRATSLLVDNCHASAWRCAPTILLIDNISGAFRAGSEETRQRCVQPNCITGRGKRITQR